MSLGFGFWVLVFGFWVLGFGFWVLGFEFLGLPGSPWVAFTLFFGSRLHFRVTNPKKGHPDHEMVIGLPSKPHILNPKPASASELLSQAKHPKPSVSDAFKTSSREQKATLNPELRSILSETSPKPVYTLKHRRIFSETTSTTPRPKHCRRGALHLLWYHGAARKGFEP